LYGGKGGTGTQGDKNRKENKTRGGMKMKKPAPPEAKGRKK
jgi:hypothetical protein